eukprot:11202810-Alexandrium_andersonii.AAC.1
MVGACVSGAGAGPDPTLDAAFIGLATSATSGPSSSSTAEATAWQRMVVNAVTIPTRKSTCLRSAWTHY